jgi:hypothetical protein
MSRAGHFPSYKRLGLRVIFMLHKRLDGIYGEVSIAASGMSAGYAVRSQEIEHW